MLILNIGGPSVNKSAKMATSDTEFDITLVVRGKSIFANRLSLSEVSRFFAALFSHTFVDSTAPVVELDCSGDMGLTDSAVRIIVTFANTRKLNISDINAVKVFIAANALEVKSVREQAENFLGEKMLNKQTFVNYWSMSKVFHMKILESFLDDLAMQHFGWFFNHVPRGYMCQWDLDKLGTSLEERKFQNCDEEIIFNAVVVYCRSKSNATESFEQLAPGLQKSCANYLRFLQSVPRTLPLPFNKLPR